jgi:WhiB family redox-sensing transcriptional regulator
MSSDWRDRAACRGADIDLFFPEWAAGSASRDTEQAKLMCRDCPVRTLCLDWALSHGAAFGIWGGRTEAERHAMGYSRKY